MRQARYDPLPQPPGLLESGGMEYRASVTLQGDPYGMHTRPAARLSVPLRDLDAAICFRRDGVECSIRPALAMVDILQAATDLSLDCGATFELVCRGPQAASAFEALRIGLTTGYFMGSVFVPCDESPEAGHV